MPAAAVSGLAGGVLSINLVNQTCEFGAEEPTGSIGFAPIISTTVNGGAVTFAGDSTASQVWLINGSSANHEVRATLSSGALDSGTVGSWVNADTIPNWVASVDAVLSVSVRDKFTQTVVDTATFTFDRI
jgi:hypothetical protein